MAAGAGSALGAAVMTGAGAGGGVRGTALGGGGGGGGSGSGGVGAATKSTTSGATSATASRTEATCISPQAAPRWARQTPATSPRCAQAGTGVADEPLARPAVHAGGAGDRFDRSAVRSTGFSRSKRAGRARRPGFRLLAGGSWLLR